MSKGTTESERHKSFHKRAIQNYKIQPLEKERIHRTTSSQHGGSYDSTFYAHCQDHPPRLRSSQTLPFFVQIVLRVPQSHLALPFQIRQVLFLCLLHPRHTRQPGPPNGQRIESYSPSETRFLRPLRQVRWQVRPRDPNVCPLRARIRVPGSRG